MIADFQRKFPLPSAWEEDLEQALAMVWSQLESGQNLRSALEALIGQEIRPGFLGDLHQKGFLHFHDDLVIFSPEGKRIAQPIVRRHRLAERLLQDVLTVTEDQMNSNACRLEHVISADVEEAICTLLGHPQVCPHGSPIPSGSCCAKSVAAANPIVVPLNALMSGNSGKVAYLSPGNRPELHKFIAMGLVPGAEFRVAQTFPAWVIEIGDTLLAMDPELCRHIYVRKRQAE